jgi:hypothetical protein
VRRPTATAALALVLAACRSEPPPSGPIELDVSARRARMVLGPDWLDRRRRSDAPFPRDVPAAGHAALGERIVGLPQLRVAGAACG